MPKTRKERREKQRTNYLEGRARQQYTHTPSLNRSLTEDSHSLDSASSGICVQFKPVLDRYADTFKSMVHRGTELKKRKHMTPNPKCTGATPYRDLKRQNEWIQCNVFDTMGNYLYCHCICAALGISAQRLARQRNIKRQLFPKSISGDDESTGRISASWRVHNHA